MRPHILLLSDFYAPFIGGTERQVELIAKQLLSRGYRASVATVWHQNLPEIQDDEGVTVYRLKALSTRVPWFSKDPGRRFHPPFPDPAITWGLRRLIERIQPDLIHSAGWITYSAAAALLGKNNPLVISARDYGFSCATKTLTYRGRACDGPQVGKCLSCSSAVYGKPKAAVSVAAVRAGKYLLKRQIRGLHSNSSFTHAIAWRDFLRNFQGGIGHSSLPDSVIPSFSDTDDKNTPEPSREFLDRLPKEPFILFVGALTPHKGIHTLLAAYKQLDSPPPLVLIGVIWPDTPREFPNGVTVIENAPHHHVLVAWDRAMFGVAPSLWPEPFGNVVHEALSRGKPVIGTVPGGMADMITDGENGYLVPSGDVERLAEAMKKLIVDPVIREHFGRAARERAHDFTASVVIPKFEALYQAVLGGKR